MAGRLHRGGHLWIAATLAALLQFAPAARADERVSIAYDRPSGRLAIGGLGKGSLVEATTVRPGPGGRVGFLAGNTWYHATSLERRLGDPRHPRLTLATNDPAGRALEIRTSAGGGSATIEIGVVGGPTADVQSVGIGFRAHGAERYLGFGERSNAVDQRGNEVENYVGEGPYAALDYPLIETQVPPWGLRQRPDATYFPMPWLVSTRGYGVLVQNTETSRFRLGTVDPDEWSAEVDSTRLRLRVFAGPKPAGVVRRMTESIGRQPAPFAPWQLGPWVQTGHQNTEPQELSNLDRLAAAGAPASAVETHMRYMPCGSDQGQETAERARTDAFHARGLAALTYTREALCEIYPAAYDRAIAANAFLRRADGTPYTFPAFVGGGQSEVGMLDFSNPAAIEIYASVLDRAYANGYDGWMEDYGEYAPPDSVAASGMTGVQMHNLYPVLYHRAGFRYARERDRPVIRFVRSGWTGVHPYAQVVWGGDPSTDWGFDGLESAVTEALTMGLSGISSWGSDVGGFFTFSSPPLTQELLIRWIQFGAVSGVMRTKAEGIGLAQDARPQVWEEPVLGVWRRYARLRTQLYPYIAHADSVYQRTGLPIMRHLALSHPGDREAVRRDDEFMFGGDLLVAPVTEPGATGREVYLPEDGPWIDFWDSVTYDEASGEFHLAEPRLMGKGERLVAAPLEELPLFARAGAILPLLPAGVDTLARYGKRTEGVVRLADRRDRFRLLAFPRGRSTSRFAGSEVTSTEGEGRWTLRIRSDRMRRYEIEASLATLRRPFEPRRVDVRVDHRGNAESSYDSRTGLLKISLRTDDGGIVVAAR